MTTPADVFTPAAYPRPAQLATPEALAKAGQHQTVTLSHDNWAMIHGFLYNDATEVERKRPEAADLAKHMRTVAASIREQTGMEANHG